MNNSKNKTIFWAVLLILAGGVLFLKNIGLLNFTFNWHFNFWALIPAIIGVNAYFDGRKLEGAFGVFLSLVFLAPNFMTDGQYEVYRKMWPLLFVFFGLAILYGLFYGKANANVYVPNEEGQINEFLIMGGKASKLVSESFSGGKIRGIMSGVELDLREAKLKQPAVLRIDLLMAGAEITVPKEWNVILEQTNIMGGSDDRIRKYPSEVIDHTQVLRIVGYNIMAGVEIRRI